MTIHRRTFHRKRSEELTEQDIALVDIFEGCLNQSGFSECKDCPAFKECIEFSNSIADMRRYSKKFLETVRRHLDWISRDRELVMSFRKDLESIDKPS